MEWQRHNADDKYHAISVIVFGHSTITRCRGRWPERDYVESHDDPPVSQCCVACLREVSRIGDADVAWIGLEALQKAMP